MKKEFILYDNYTYRELEEWFCNEVDKDPNVKWNELGDFAIGESFIVINMNDLTLSFILAGYNNELGGIYQLIYKE